MNRWTLIWILCFELLALVPWASAQQTPARSAEIDAAKIGNRANKRVESDYQQVLPLDNSPAKQIVIRGARPDDLDFENLKALGVKNVLNLESSDDSIEPTEELGFNVMRVPLPPLLAKPDKGALAEIVEILQDPKSYPLFIHCKQGRDRTGLVVALYRVIVENASPEAAYRDMLQNGFHEKTQLGLKCAFFEVLDLPTPKRCALVPRRTIRLKF